jgi:hypothetical protein
MEEGTVYARVFGRQYRYDKALGLDLHVVEYMINNVAEHLEVLLFSRQSYANTYASDHG